LGFADGSAQVHQADHRWINYGDLRSCVEQKGERPLSVDHHWNDEPVVNVTELRLRIAVSEPTTKAAMMHSFMVLPASSV
jgi:hypothetical protein